MKKDKFMEKEFKINNRVIGGDNSTYIIAEIARTYQNNRKIAERMIREAAKAGVDAVKIQSIETEELLVKNSNTKNHYQRLKRLERSFEDHLYLAENCRKYKIDFLSTPESLKMVDLLEKTRVKAYKIASLDIVYYDLLKYIARKQKPIFLSTGMANMEEIRKALKIIRSEGNNKIILLYCVSLYPPKPEEIDLNTIKTFRETFKVIPGFSDHTPDISTTISAVALGAKVIEKHFTLDRSQSGDDHKVSVEPEELKKMIREIRRMEKMLQLGDKTLSKREYKLREIKRRKMVAAKDLKKGIKLKKNLLKFKQIDTSKGIQSQHEKEVFGKILKVNLKKDKPLLWKIIQ
ncbi:MAG TPA: hypothetical protein ENH90_00460 [bacterium]|nr:hypothetical protein [bacterium]